MSTLRQIAFALLLMRSVCVFAESPVTLTPDLSNTAAAIPSDFIGVSFETGAILPNNNGEYLFSTENKPLIAMFKLLGIKNLRIGGNSLDRATTKVPGERDIDSVYAFAKAADVSVIYSVRLRDQTDPASATAIAKYIMDHYKSQTVCLTIGNEPNVYFKEYAAYRDQWKKFADAIAAEVPDVQFCGPSATPGKRAWCVDFAKDFAPAGHLKFISEHSYPGGDAEKMTDGPAGRTHILAPQMLKDYQKFYDDFVPVARQHNLGFRLEEANSVFHGGAKDISNSFASALWGLDYLHWWAQHGALGINLHTGSRRTNSETQIPAGYDLFWTTPSGFQVHPLGYAVKAFDIGSHGKIVPVTIKSKDQLNLTAYAVVSEKNELFVTVINKENGPAARNADVTINAGRNFKRLRCAFMTVPKNDIAALTGTTLGDFAIAPDATWLGEWSAVSGNTLHVPAASAAIIKCTAK